MALGHKEGLGADAVTGPVDQPDRNLDLSRVRLWHQAEVPPAAKEGRLRLQSGLWQAIHGRVYEFTP